MILKKERWMKLYLAWVSGRTVIGEAEDINQENFIIYDVVEVKSFFLPGPEIKEVYTLAGILPGKSKPVERMIVKPCWYIEIEEDIDIYKAYYDYCATNEKVINKLRLV